MAGVDERVGAFHAVQGVAPVQDAEWGVPLCGLIRAPAGGPVILEAYAGVERGCGVSGGELEGDLPFCPVGAEIVLGVLAEAEGV